MLSYEGKVFRPPSEWKSLIVQATVGCANNTCTFCTMYKEDSFHVKDEEQLFKELEETAAQFNGYERIFVADGDALCLSTDRLLRLFHKLKELFPYAKRIGIYGTARDINKKSIDELIQLKEAGLGIIYLGVETGDPKLLEKIKKTITVEEYIEAAKKTKEAGIPLSVTLIAGLGGREGTRDHAIESAKVISQMEPEYTSFLTLMLDPSAPIMREIEFGRMTLLTPQEVLREIDLFLENYTGEKTSIFRANHASNYASLAGNLPEDIHRLRAEIDHALNTNQIKPEAWRGL